MVLSPRTARILNMSSASYANIYYIMFIIDSACIWLAVYMLLKGMRLAAFSTLLTGLLIEFLVKALPLLRRLSFEWRYFIAEFRTTAVGTDTPDLSPAAAHTAGQQHHRWSVATHHHDGANHGDSSITKTTSTNFESRTLHVTNCTDMLVRAQSS
jgi:hypothetical protein